MNQEIERRLTGFFGIVVVMATALGCVSTEASEVEESEASAEPEYDREALPFYATGPVARVDGTEIGPEEFNAAVADNTERMPGNVPAQMVGMLQEKTLDSVIDKHLVGQALESANIEVTDQEIEEAYREARAQVGESEEEVQQRLDRMGVTEEELRERAEQDARLVKYLARDYDLEVTDEEVRTFFEQNRERFGEPERVAASHILIEVAEDADEETEQQARRRAQSIYEDVRGGADFAEVAREESEGPSAPDGGDLGLFPRAQMVEPFSETAFDELEVGEISEPVRTRFGYHVIKKTDHQQGDDAELAEVRDRIERQLRSQQRQQAFQQFLQGRKADAEIERIEDNIVTNVESGETSTGTQEGGKGLELQKPETSE